MLFRLGAFQAYIPQMIWKESYMIMTNVRDVLIYMDIERNIIYVVKKLKKDLNKIWISYIL